MVPSGRAPVGVSGTPTIFIDDVRDDGERDVASFDAAPLAARTAGRPA